MLKKVIYLIPILFNHTQCKKEKKNEVHPVPVATTSNTCAILQCVCSTTTLYERKRKQETSLSLSHVRNSITRAESRQQP